MDEVLTWSGDAVRAFRAEVGLSQSRFALLLGIGLSSLKHLEAGRPPGPQVCRRLSAAQAEHRQGSLDLSWVAWHSGPRGKRAKRPEVIRGITCQIQREKAIRARLECTLLPGRKQARLIRNIISLQIRDISALEGLLQHVRAAI